MNQVAVLITAFNRKEKTIQAIDSFMKSIHLIVDYSFDFYLVDDNSTDGTAESVINKFPFVNILHGNGNLYWCRGMNFAWDFASKQKEYDFYIWLNDDVILFENSVPMIFSSSSSINHTSIISGAFRSEFSDVVTYGGLVGDNFKVPNGILQEIDLLNGNFVLIPKIVFIKIGQFDSFFHHGMGDFDYGLRAKKKGIKSFITPNYIGYCERHDDEKLKCFDTKISLIKRLKFLYSPKGPNPLVNSLFYVRHCSVVQILSFFLSTNFIAFFPFFLGKKRKIVSFFSMKKSNK